MPRSFSHSLLLFLSLRVISVLLHYLGSSPWGGPLALRPSRFLPEALLLELLVWTLLTYAFWLSGLALRRGRRQGVFAAYLLTSTVLSIFSQIDLEVVRWLGQHMTLSYIQNFAGARDGKLFARILSSDRFASSLAALQIIVAPAVAVFCWQRYRTLSESFPKKATSLALAAVVLISALPFLLRPSEKRWRRVRPASLGLVLDASRSLLGLDRPRDPERARQDLIDWVTVGHLDAKHDPEDPKYPLLRDDNVGRLPLSQFRSLPKEQRPDVILVVFETLRGMNGGLLNDEKSPFDAMPKLAARFKREARYFPRVHSAGYPSVEGALGMHLGIWPHFEKIVFSTYLHVPLWSFPELLREGGYRSFALLGADPSFSNFTPWFRRWYDDVDFSPARHHDGPLVDHFIEIYDRWVGVDQPQLFTLWTASTHPPYDVPKETGILPASTNEERYLQAMHYADEQIDHLIDHLQKSPRWDHTVVFVLGDHSQPTPWQWRNTDKIGELTPGHTWTSMGMLGGGDFKPVPGRVETAISHVHLAPTILAAVNLRHKNHFFAGQVWNQANEKEVVAFRYGTASIERRDQRSIFRVQGGPALSYRFLPHDIGSYGALENGSLEPASTSLELDRYRDMALYWAQLLEDQEVAPHLLPTSLKN